ncbi:E3 ubiquitin-protein ligase RGLG1-like isoform X2 [Magnolia sinica]|uniref:E3 ubiquitin-protein ligase RGLG1-like isoform X2 n=1 Tax=Magnolia sinica TaxID=86752 RepID=UPI002658CB4C|nr:E3 ubiquitin-protein ligase RGLG1-like isoform X2 [Magnolia sinica]
MCVHANVTAALAHTGLESSNLIVGIDFTKSNEWTGQSSFNRQGLHHIGSSPNAYERAISIIGRTLSAFDEDDLIPCFGFGDASTHDQEVFSFFPDGRPCNGFEEALSRYREIVPHIRLSGPTSFAPIIETAIGIVEKSRGQYHVLLIIADGQVTQSVDMDRGHLSPQERDTISAIVKASDYPLSIVLVGVGDGPWDMMRQFDDNIHARSFDNFQFVNFTEIMAKNIPSFKKETEFALAALMEIPSQYKATIELQLLGCTRGTPVKVPLPPPLPLTNPAPQEISQLNNLVCPVCLWNAKDLAFGCGHRTCYECGRDLELCPICRSYIIMRIRLF